MVIGFTSVVGDLLHPGHLAMIEESAGQCDILIVGLICDPTDRRFKNKPVETVFERWYRLMCCKGVFNVVPLQGEQDLELALEMLETPAAQRSGGKTNTPQRTAPDAVRQVCYSSGCSSQIASVIARRSSSATSW